MESEEKLSKKPRTPDTAQITLVKLPGVSDRTEVSDTSTTTVDIHVIDQKQNDSAHGPIPAGTTNN